LHTTPVIVKLCWLRSTIAKLCNDDDEDYVTLALIRIAVSKRLLSYVIYTV